MPQGYSYSNSIAGVLQEHFVAPGFIQVSALG